MARQEEPATSAETPEPLGREVERPLLVLMAARLVLGLAGLLIGLVFDWATLELGKGPEPAFYATVLLLFVATGLYWGFAGRVRHPRVFGAINMLTDMLLVSGLVVFSGGLHSVFTFCYVIVGLYGGLLFPAWGAVLCAATGAAAYAGVLAAGQAGWLGAEVTPEPLGTLASNWAAHAGALLGSSALSGFLSRELARTGRALVERTQDLEQLRTLHERTVESLRSGLLTTDLRNRITSFNQEAECITGWSRGRALGRTLDELFPDLARGTRRQDGPSRERRFRMECEGGGGRPVHLGFGAYVLHDAEGEPCGEVVIFQDVTEVVAMEQELRRSERLAAVGELSASIAHEIRNPLAAISGSVQMLNAARGEGQGEGKRLREIVVREVDRLDALIQDFLQFARPGEARPEAVVLEDLVKEVIEMSEADDREARVSIESDISPGLTLWADPSQLRQVLWNLLRNASQAMPDGGVVRIEGHYPSQGGAQEDRGGDRTGEQPKPPWCEIALMDQGCGIPAEVAEHMFDPFFTTKTDGSGLGLAIVHRVVQEHGGSIRVERGGGRFATAIRLTLPAGQDPV